MISGILLQLKRRGREAHYLNIANHSCCSATINGNETVEMRSAKMLSVKRKGILETVYRRSLL